MRKTSQSIILDLELQDSHFESLTSIQSASELANLEVAQLEETIDSVRQLTPDCDKIDYALAAGSGVLCGIIDIFLVGKPGESPIGEITDKWFAERTKDFAKRVGWNPRKDGTLQSAICKLEEKFQVPYDQTRFGEATMAYFGYDSNMTTFTHHFESLGHNPTLMGLFFSILDQFTFESHFVHEGELISIVSDNGSFKLEGHNIISKLWCGFTNWLGHIISDISGSSGSAYRGKRGMGVPSPIWAWVNDTMVIKRKLGIANSEFDESICKIAIELFNEGFDARFQTAQAIPVFINSLIVRGFYSIRRTFRYFYSVPKEKRSFKEAYAYIRPYKNPSITRMLTIAHGTFCLVDIGDATVRGFVKAIPGTVFNPIEFFLRLNVAGVGRFTISLFGEVNYARKRISAKSKAQFAAKEKLIVENYLEGLKELSKLYDDSDIINFIEDFSGTEKYKDVFDKAVELAAMRNADLTRIPKDKAEIDRYFTQNNGSN